ncbi:MAG: hypothetical protein ABII18_04365 [bacterium]|nr:hypothetical protein [bacterium]
MPVTPNNIYDMARLHDIALGPVEQQLFAASPEMKCRDAVVDAYHMVDGVADRLGQIKIISCNNPMPLSTVSDFAKKHGLAPRTDLESCPTMSTSISPEATSFLQSKDWRVSPHMIASPRGLFISLVHADPNKSFTLTKLSETEIQVTVQECSGSTMTATINVDTDNVSM